MRIGDAGFGCEVRPVDDVTAIARQLLVALLLGRRGARFCELPGDAADFNDGLAAGVGQHDRHLQEDAEEVADVVGSMLGEALGAVAALEQEAVSRCNGRKLSFQFARFTGKHQRRKARKPRLDIMQSLGVGIFRHLQNGLRRASYPATIYRLVERTPSSTPESGINRAIRHHFQARSVSVYVGLIGGKCGVRQPL